MSNTSSSYHRKFRRLEAGEIILETDELYDDHKKEWVHPGISVGEEAPDPSYSSHREYRRKITKTEKPNGNERM